MAIHLNPEIERLVQDEIRNGHFHSVDEIILEGIHARREGSHLSPEPPRKTPAEAVAHIRQMRKGNLLPAGVTIKGLIDKGRS